MLSNKFRMFKEFAKKKKEKRVKLLHKQLWMNFIASFALTISEGK